MPNFIDLKDLSKDQLLDLISLSLKWKKEPCPNFMNNKHAKILPLKSLRISSAISVQVACPAPTIPSFINIGVWQLRASNPHADQSIELGMRVANRVLDQRQKTAYLLPEHWVLRVFQPILRSE